MTDNIFDIYERWEEGIHQNNHFNAYGTHQPILIEALKRTSGDVIELGTGDFSTPQLHKLCKNSNRKLVSIDTDEQWLNRYRNLENKNHKIILQNKFEKYHWDCPLLFKKYGLALVDNAPGESRVSNIRKLKTKTDVILAHDSQELGYPILTHQLYHLEP